jgi:hypothetical protein
VGDGRKARKEKWIPELFVEKALDEQTVTTRVLSRRHIVDELIAVLSLVVSLCALRALLATLKMTKRAVKAARRARQSE